MLGIKCAKHSLYNGAKLFSEQCDACAMIHAVNKTTYHIPDLEAIQPIRLLDLNSASTPSLLAEIERRIG
jgi:hypothetical protein